MQMNSFNPSPRTSLTPRESEILNYILAGCSNKLTAYELGISQRTVEVHRSRIFQKLGVRNAIELITSVYSRSTSTLPPTSTPNQASVAKPSVQHIANQSATTSLLPDAYPHIQPAGPPHPWPPSPNNHMAHNELVLAEPGPPSGEPPTTSVLCKTCGRPVTQASAGNTAAWPAPHT